jgi:primosomal protein N' (replication factor Y)
MPFVLNLAMAAPLWQPLTYLAPDDLAPMIRPLTRVVAPLRGRPCLGFALESPVEGKAKGLKKIQDVLDGPGSPGVWPAEMLDFFQKTAAYYGQPLGMVLAGCLPAGLGAPKKAEAREAAFASEAVANFRQGDPKRLPKPESQAGRILRLLRKKGSLAVSTLRPEFPRATPLCKQLESAGWAEITHRPLVKDILGQPLWPEPKPERFTPDQTAALETLLPAVREGNFAPFLLEGVTGSGKTEVYLAAVQEALDAGRQALVLTPEIGLCLRLEGLLANRFGTERVASMHSGLTPAARRGQWLAVASGRAVLASGARSAVFAPFTNPGVIIVDEEQDEAYKQEDRLRYNARDLALLRGREQSCPVILGTATPSAVSFHGAESGRLEKIAMPRRVKEVALPKVEVIDLRTAGRLRQGFLSPALHLALEKTLHQGNQAMLFLNRRGFAPALICPSCGKTVGCPSCSLSLTLHKKAGRLNCHTCGHSQPLPAACPWCGADGAQMKPLGLGTESVAEKLADVFPEARLCRLDRDTASNAKKLSQSLKEIAARKVDIIVGTQMITKGHHFPGLALVGVLMADQALAAPDFKAAERAYVLLTQVAGRAGREGGPGRVLVQTYDPDHHAVKAAVSHKPEEFYRVELEQRKALFYPPYSRLAGLKIESADPNRAGAFAAELARCLIRARREVDRSVQVLGPAQAPVFKTHGKHRFLIMVKAKSPTSREAVLRLGRHRAGAPPKGVKLVVDLDPNSLG